MHKPVIQFSESKRKTEYLLDCMQGILPENIAIIYIDKNKDIEVCYSAISRLELMGMLSAALTELWAGDD